MSATMIPKKTHVSVVSSGFECGNTATIHVDGTPMLPIPRRGFNVLVLSPVNNTWQPQASYSFDTHEDLSAEEGLDLWLHQLSSSDGTLVVMTVCGDAVNKLSEKTRSSIATVLGSKLIRGLAYRCSFALVSRIGDGIASEAVSNNTKTSARVDAYIGAPDQHGLFVSATSAGFNTDAESFALVGSQRFPTDGRGLNVIEIDETSGVVIKHQVFDTFAKTAASESFAEYIGSLPNNRIVIVFVLDEASYNLTAHAIAASESLGGDHLDELAFRDAYVLIGGKGWTPCSAYESVPESSVITVSCRFDIPKIDISNVVLADNQPPTHACRTSTGPHGTPAMQSSMICKEFQTEVYRTVAADVVDGESVVTVTNSSFPRVAATLARPHEATGPVDQHQSDVKTLSGLIERSPQFKSVALVLQRAYDFPADREAFQSGQNALKSIWRETLLNLGGGNVANMTLLKKVFEFEHGVLAIDSSTGQPIFAQGSSELIIDVIDNVLAAATAARNSLPETETLRIMRSALGQSDAQKLQSELFALSAIDEKLRLALVVKTRSAEEKLSNAKARSLEAHIGLADELRRKLSSANDSAESKRNERIQILKIIDGFTQTIGDLLSHDSELNPGTLAEAVDPDFGLSVILDVIEKHYKRWSEAQKSQLDEIELLDELTKQLQTFTQLANASEREIEQEKLRVVSLKRTITEYEKKINSHENDKTTATSKLEAANIDLQKYKSRQDMLKQATRDINAVTDTKTINGDVFNRLQSSVTGVADIINQLRIACDDYITGKICLSNILTNVTRLKAERQTLSQDLQICRQRLQTAIEKENMALIDYNNEADRVADGKATKDNPNKILKWRTYSGLHSERIYCKNNEEQSIVRSQANEKKLVMANEEYIKAQQSTDNSASRISELCRDIKSSINSQDVDIKLAILGAEANVRLYQQRIKDAVTSIATNNAKKLEAASSLQNAHRDVLNNTRLLLEIKKRVEYINQQISSDGMVEYRKPNLVVPTKNKEAKMLVAERDATLKKLQSIDNHLFMQQQYINKLTSDLEYESQIIADLSHDATAVTGAILEAEQTCKRDIDRLVMEFTEQLNANIAVAGYSTFAAWNTDKNNEIRGQSLLRCLVGRARGLLRPFRVGDDSDVLLAAGDISEVQKSSVENLVTKLLKKYPSNEMTGSTAYDLAAALINEEFSADANYHQMSVHEIRSSSNNSDAASVFFQSFIKRPSANILLYDASDSSHSEIVELRPSFLSESVDAVEFLKTLSRYASSEWSLNSLVPFLANLLLRKPFGEATIEEIGESIRAVQAMHGNVELTANKLQEAITPIVTDYDNPNYKLDPVAQLGVRLMDRLFGIRTIILQAESSHIDSNSDELILLAKGISRALGSFIDKLSQAAMDFLQKEIQRRRDAILSGSESSLGGQTADRISELNSAIDQQTAALENKQAELRKLESLADNKDKHNSRVAIVTDELNRIQLRIEQLSRVNAEKLAELAELRETKSNLNAETEKLLNDIQSLRDEIAKLKSERASVERKLSLARDAEEEAAKILTAAEDDVRTLQAKLETTQKLLDDSKTELEEMTRWSAFVKIIRDAINTDFDVIRMRFNLTNEYKDIRCGNMKDVFPWLSRSLPKLSDEANYWISRGNALWASDLCSKVLDDKLYTNPILALQIGVAFTISGPSLSYSEASQLLRRWVVARLEPLGLALDKDDKVYVEVPAVVPGFRADAMPKPLQVFFANRIQNFYQNKQDKPRSSTKHWDDLFNVPGGLEAAKYYTEMFEAGYGADLMDIVLAFAPTVEILTGFNFLIDVDVKLPGINFYVTCAGNVRVDADITIDTSATDQPKLRYNKARNGSDPAYRIGSREPYGRDGDDGLDGAAGFNGGHVTIRAAYGSIVGGGSINVKTHGEKGHDGQSGGDGDAGIKGYNVPNAEAPDTSIWYRNMTVGISRFPGQDENRKFPPEGGYPNEISGNGGDGGISGLGGEGGEGGDVYFRDINQILSIERGKGESEHSLKDKLDIRISTVNNVQGTDPSGSRGGPGGQPGQRGLDEVKSKSNFWVKTKSTICTIDVDSKEFKEAFSDVGWLNIMFDPVYYKYGHLREVSYDQRFGWTRVYKGKAMPDVPKLSGDIQKRHRVDNRSVGKVGAAFAASQESSTRQRQQRQQHQNVSTLSSYQKKMYAAAQAMQVTEQYLALDSVYSQMTQQLDQSVQALQEAKEQTVREQQAASMRVEQAYEQQKQAEKQLDSLTKQHNDIEAMHVDKAESLNAAEVRALAILASSLALTKEAAQLQKEIQGNQIDSEMSQEQIAMIREVAAAVEAQLATKQAQLLAQKQQIQIEIAALTRAIAASRLRQDQVIQIEQLASLDHLLSQLSSRNLIQQQQQQQQSMQAEADLEGDSSCASEDNNVLVRAYFRHDDKGVWAFLSPLQANRLENLLTTLSTEIPDVGDDRLVALERLELLLRYGIYCNVLEMILLECETGPQNQDDQPPTEPSDSNSALGQRLASVLKVNSEKIRLNHWFCVSLSGVSIGQSPDSSEFLTISDVSLQARYIGIATVPAKMKLTGFEQYIRQVLDDMRKNGPDVAALAKLLKQYSSQLINAQLGRSSGLMALCEGRPVTFLDQISRILLLYVRKSDDTLVKNKLEIVLGAAQTISNIVCSLGIPLLLNAVTRKRDSRGNQQPPTTQLLKNLELAQQHFDQGRLRESMTALRSDKLSVIETKQSPQSTNELIALIQSLPDVASNEMTVTERSTLIAQVIGAGVVVRSESDITLVLSALGETGGKIPELNLASCVSSAAVAYLSAISPNTDFFERLQECLHARLLTPSIGTAERVKRIIAFCNIAKLKFESGEKSEIDRIAATKTLARSSIAYALYSVRNMKAIQSLLKLESNNYEDLVEQLAYDISSCNPCLLPTTLFNAEKLLPAIIAAREQAPILNDLATLAISCAKNVVTAKLLEQMETQKDVNLNSASIGKELLKYNISEESDKLEVFSNVLKQLKHQDVHRLWMTAVSDTAADADDLHRLLVALLQNSEVYITLDALVVVYSTASTAQLSIWKDVLELTLAHSVNTLIDHTMELFDKSDAQRSTLVGYMAQVVTAALRDPAIDSESPSTIRVGAIKGLLHVHEAGAALKKSVSQHKATIIAGSELKDKIAESQYGCIYQLVAVAYDFGIDQKTYGRSLTGSVAANQVKIETDALRDKIATLLLDVGQMEQTDTTAAKTVTYRLNVLYPCFHICAGSDPSYLIDSAAAIKVSRTYLTAKGFSQNIRDVSSDILVRIIRAVEKRLVSKATDDASKRQKTIDSITDAAQSTLLITTVKNAELKKLIEAENDRRVQIWRTMLIQLEDLNSNKSELDRTATFDKVIGGIQSSTKADNVDDIIASAVNLELVSLRSKEVYKLPELFSQDDTWGIHAEKMKQIIEAIHLAPETNFRDYVIAACEAAGTHTVNIMQSSVADNFKSGLTWVLDHFCHMLNHGYFLRNNEHQELLQDTIRAISYLSLTVNMDELLTNACRNLCNVLSLCDFQHASYSQADLIRRATYDDSNLFLRLKLISDTASTLFDGLDRAITADVVLADDQNRAANLVEAVRTSQNFTSDSVISAVAVVNQTADSSFFVHSDVIISYDQALKAVLALPKEQNVNLVTLSLITKALREQPPSAQVNIAATIVSQSFIRCIKSIVGYAHFAMGRAVDSDYNEELRSTDEEQAHALREFKAASEYGCLPADSNIASIDFVSKLKTASFEKTRQDMLPVLKHLASKGDENAKRNVELLDRGQPLSSRYEFSPPPTMPAEDRANEMATFRCAVSDFVDDIMRIIDGIDPLTSIDGIGVLEAIFGSSTCQVHANSVKDLTLSLEQQSHVFLKFSECIASGIATAPPFAKIGVIAAAQELSSFKLESKVLIPYGALFMCMRSQFLPEDLRPGLIIKAVFDSFDAPYEMSGCLQISHILLAGALLKRDVKIKLAALQADLDKRTISADVISPDLDVEHVNFALLNRAQELFFIKLKAIAETVTTDESGKSPKPTTSVILALDQIQKVLPLMCDFTTVNLSVEGSMLTCLRDNGITVKELMTSEEIAFVQSIGDDLSAAACRVGSSPTTSLRHPATWESWLRRTWLEFALNTFMKQSLDRSIQAVVEPVIRYGKNLRLKRLDDELTKLKNAYDSLTLPDLVDNCEHIEKAYQDIFNCNHYILYLTTTDYILSEMVPAHRSIAKEDEFEKLKADMIPIAGGLVKQIKVACNIMIDLFGCAKMVHENLIAAMTLWKEANLFGELISMVSLLMAQPQDNNLKGLGYFMWLLSKDEPGLVMCSVRYESSLGTTYFKTITRRIADSLVAFVEQVSKHKISGGTANEEFNKRLSNVVSWLQSGAVPDDERGWRYSKLVFASITQTALRPGKDDAFINLLTFKQIRSILDALELSRKCEAWSSDELINRLQMLTNMDSWVPLLENQCIKLSLGYDEVNTNEVDKEKFDRTVSGIVRLTGRRGQLVGSAFQSCLCELLRLAKPKNLADIAERVASNRYKFNASDINTYKEAGRLETGDQMMDYLSEFYEKIQEQSDRSASRIVAIMQEEINNSGMNEGVSNYVCYDSTSTNNSTMMEQRLTAIGEIFNTKFSKFSKQQIVDWSREFRSKRAEQIFRNIDINGINEMLAIFQRVVKCANGFLMRIPQLMSVILFVDALCNGRARLGEIGTGEGKSIIAVLCAATCIFMGRRVDVLSSNKVLAQRDAEEALKYMEYFDISVSNNCDDKAENDENERAHRYKTKEVIFGEAGYFQRDILLSMHFDKKIRDKLAPCLIVDEVDSMFIDTIGNTLYISHSIEDLKHLSDVFVQIWIAVHGADASEASEANVAKVSEFISNQITTGVLLVPNQLHDYTLDRIKTWVRSAYQAKMMSIDDQYTTISSGKRRGEVVVMDLYSGVEQMTTRWSNGLHQFIQIKHSNRLSPESLKAIFMANLQFFKEYGNNIIGMTGTIGGRSERQMLASTYSCDFFRMPRYAEENFYEDPPVIAGNRARWLELVAEEAVNQAIFGCNYGFEDLKDPLHFFNIEDAKNDLVGDQKKLDNELHNLREASLQLTAARRRSGLNKTLKGRIDTIQKDLQTTSVLYKCDLDTLTKLLDELTANTMFSSSSTTIEVSDRQAQCSTWLKITKDSLESLKTNVDEFANITLKLKIMETEIVETDLRIKNASTPAELAELKNQHKDQQDTALDLTLQLRSIKDQSILLQKDALDATKTLLSTCSELLKLATGADEQDVHKLVSNEASIRNEVTKLNVKIQAHKYAIEFGGGRAVLIICRNKLDAKDVANTLMNDQRLASIYVFHGTIEGVTKVDCKTRKILQTQVPLEEVRQRDIIVSTNIAGRGLSLKLTKWLKKCGGLHVVISFVPENVRVESQAWGRAARQGDPGSGRFVICEPNLTALSGDVSMAYLLMQRDTNEQQRLDIITTETVPRIDMEKSLFGEFALLTAELDKMNEFKTNNEEQRIALRDRWAFFLEQQGQDLEDIFKDPVAIKERINRAFQNFRSCVLKDVKTGTYGLIKDPGNLIRIVHAALKNGHYQRALETSDAIVQADPRFGAYGYYYKALALFGSGTEDMNCKVEAMSLLYNAIKLFNREIDMLQSQSQIVKALNGNENKKGKGTGPDYFTMGNCNTASMIQVHVNAAEMAIGYAISESNFETSAISGDLKTGVFNIITSEPAIHNLLLPFRLCCDLEIRVLLDIADRNKSSRWLNGRAKDVDYSISGNTATLQGCTTAELDEIEEANVAFELQLVRRGNALSGAGDMPVFFPDQFSYAVQKIIRNIHVAAVNKSKSSLNFETITDRSKLSEWIFSPLIKENEAKAYFSALADGDEQEYLVVNDDWRSAIMGRWDETGFHGIGKQLREWFVDLVDKHSARHIATKVALAKATELLSDKEKNSKLSQESIDCMVRRGVVTKKKLIAVKSLEQKLISDYEDTIHVPENADETALQKLDLSGYPILHNNRNNVLNVIKNHCGKEMKSEHLSTALTCSDEDASDAFVVLKALMRMASLDSFLCERLKLNVPKEHRDAVDTALERIKCTIEPNAWESVGKQEDLHKSLVSQHVILQPQIGPQTFDKSGYSAFLSSGSHVDRVQDAVGKYCEKNIREFVKRVKKPAQDENDMVEQFISDIKDALKKSIGQLTQTSSRNFKVSLQTLEDMMDKKDLPPELMDFFQSCSEIVFSVEEKKSWWDWNAFAVAMIGLVQVVAGAVILVLTAGAATAFGNALIGEGIGDMIYATQAGLSGTFSWKEWGIQKSITMGISILTAGVGAFMSRGVQVAKIGFKLTTAVVAKAVAKKILGQILNAAVMKLITFGTDKLADLVTKELFNTYRKHFSSWVRDNAMAQNSINQCKKELTKLVQNCGREKAGQYLREAVQKSLDHSNSILKDIVGKIESNVMDAAGKLGSILEVAAGRLEYGSSNKIKLLTKISNILSICAKASKVVFALQDIVVTVPLVFNDLSKRLQKDRLNTEQSQQSSMTEDEATAIADELMQDKAVNKVLDVIESITKSRITSFAFKQVLDIGLNRLSKETIGKLGGDYKALHDRALALGALRDLRAKNPLEGETYREKLEWLEEKMHKSSKYASPLVDLKGKANETVVRYMGKQVTIGEIRDLVGDFGLRAVPAADGSLYLMRSDIDNYVKSLSVHKRSNVADLNIYAAAAGADIKLIRSNSSFTMLIHCATAVANLDGKRPVITLKLVTDDNHPNGHYVMMQKNQNTGSLEPVQGLISIGNSCAPQQLVYFRALQSGKTETQARELANKKENIDEFISKAREMATTNHRVSAAYYNRKQDIWPDVIGGAYKQTPKIKSEVTLKRQMALENQVNKFMIVKEKRDFDFAYKKYFGDNREFAVRDVTRYITAHKNTDGSDINDSLKWVKNTVNKDPQFLSRSPFEQFQASRKEGYDVSQVGPWPLPEKPNIAKSEKTWMADKSDQVSVNFEKWGFPILEEYAKAVANSNDHHAVMCDHNISTQLLASDNAAVSSARLRLPSTDQSVFSDNLKRGIQNLGGFAWHHVGHAYGSMLVVPTEIRQLILPTTWDSVLRYASIRDSTEFTKQRDLKGAMDAYSGQLMDYYEIE